MTTEKTTSKKKAAPKQTAVKSTTKKTVVKKSAPIKEVVTTTPVVKKACNTKFHMIYTAVIIILLGFVLSDAFDLMKGDHGDNDHRKTASKKVFNTDASFVEHNGATWIRVEGKPVELIILNDKTCGSACDTNEGINSVKQNLTQALGVRNVDITSKEGKKLIETFSITSIPAYILGKGAAEFEINGTKFVEGAAAVLNNKDEMYAFTSAAGFPLGKFIVTPDIDTENEPTKGDGPVTVIEFTDFECPFCKRLSDQTTPLIKELVEAGAITYVVKDFPLPFHKAAMPVHKALNCTQSEGSNEAYFSMKETIFADQSIWNQKSGEDLTNYLVDLANINGANIATCIDSSEATAEIQADIAEGSKYGVTGTPGIFVGGQFAPGAISAEQLRTMVESEVK